MARSGELIDPYGSFNFLVEIDGIGRAHFQECSGLDSTIDVTEYREGGTNTSPRKIPGQTKYGNITLKWGVTDDVELRDWHQKCVEGEIERKNFSIVLLNRKGAEVERLNCRNAWPASWKGADLNAEGSDVAIETLEIAHEGFERA